MGKSLRVIVWVLIFVIMASLIFDMNKFRETKEIIKDAMDLATKAAVLQIDMNRDQIAEGIFLIDNDKACAEFIRVMALNLNCDEQKIRDSMQDYHAINTIGPYTNPLTGKTYQINKPTFVAAIKFKFNGIFIKHDIVVTNNFDGSVLLGKE